LECSWPVTEALQAAAVVSRKLPASELDQLAGSDVEQVGSRRRQLVHVRDSSVQLQLTTVLLKTSHQRVRDGLRTPSGDGPTRSVRCNTQDQREGGTAKGVEWHHGVCRDAAKQRPRRFGFEVSSGQALHGAECGQAEAA